MKRGQSQNYSAPSSPLPAKRSGNYPGYSKKVSVFMEVEQRCVIPFFVEKGMKGMEIIGRVNEHYSGDALHRAQVDHWIQEVKFGGKIFQTSRHWERH
jgi:hypothetical protein